LVGEAVHGLLPGITSVPAAYALVGMGGFLAATTHAPLTSILMLFEMTLVYHASLTRKILLHWNAPPADGVGVHENLAGARGIDIMSRARVKYTCHGKD